MSQTKEKSSMSPDKLRELLEDESANLYDYLMRMTGQIARSLDTCDEVIRVITKWYEENPEAGFKEVRSQFYLTARNFAADIWDAEIAELENLGFHESPIKPNEVEALKAWEKEINDLTGIDREVLLLSHRYGFDAAEIKLITKLDENIEAYMAKLDQNLTGTNSQLTLVDALATLPHHPKPQRTTLHTQALSHIMKNIKSRRGPWWRDRKVWLGIGIVIILGFLMKNFLFG